MVVSNFTMSLELPNIRKLVQRPKDIVQELVSGDLDLGIVGLDMLSEYGQGNEDLILVHDALGYAYCRLSLAIPENGIFENINSLGRKFLKDNGLQHVALSTADGALEARPRMGVADVIVDLVSSGTTLKENYLKEIEGGVLLKSQEHGVMEAELKSYEVEHVLRSILTITELGPVRLPMSEPFGSKSSRWNKTLGTGLIGKRVGTVLQRKTETLRCFGTSIVVGETGSTVQDDRGDELETTLDVTEEEVGVREKSRIEMVRKKVIKRCSSIASITSIRNDIGAQTGASLPSLIKDMLAIFSCLETFRIGHRYYPSKFVFLPIEHDPPWKPRDLGPLQYLDPSILELTSVDLQCSNIVVMNGLGGLGSWIAQYTAGARNVANLEEPFMVCEWGYNLHNDALSC
ncbi:ATP phosphoribosyltransferase 2, chloroplastic-like protein [Tanacetum coccineum]